MAAEGPIREEQAGFRHQCLVSSCQSYNLLYIPVAYLCKVNAFGIVGTEYPCYLVCQELPQLKVCNVQSSACCYISVSVGFGGEINSWKDL